MKPYTESVLVDQGGTPGLSMKNIERWYDDRGLNFPNTSTPEGSETPSPVPDQLRSETLAYWFRNGYDNKYVDNNFMSDVYKRNEARVYDAQWRIAHADDSAPTPYFGNDVTTARFFLSMPTEDQVKLTRPADKGGGFFSDLKDAWKGLLEGPIYVVGAAVTAGALAPATADIGAIGAAAGSSVAPTLESVGASIGSSASVAAGAAGIAAASGSSGTIESIGATAGGTIAASKLGTGFNSSDLLNIIKAGTRGLTPKGSIPIDANGNDLQSAPLPNESVFSTPGFNLRPTRNKVPNKVVDTKSSDNSNLFLAIGLMVIGLIAVSLIRR